MASSKQDVEISLSITGINEQTFKKITDSFSSIKKSVDSLNDKLKDFSNTLNSIGVPESFGTLIKSFKEFSNIKITNIKTITEGLSNISKIKALPDIAPFTKAVRSLNGISIPNLSTFTNSLNSLKGVKLPDLSLFSKSVKSLNGITPPNLIGFTKSLSSLKGLTLPNLSTFVASIKSLKGITLPSFNNFTTSLKSLVGVKLPSLTSFINGLEKLSNVNTENISKKLKELNAELNKLGAVGNLGWISKLSNDLSSASSNVKKIEDALKNYNETIQKSSRNTINFGERIKIFLQYKMIGTAVRLFEQSVVSAISSIVDFDQSLKDLQAITGANSIELAEMSEKVLQVAKDTKFSASEVAEGMRIIGQAGFTSTESITAMEAVANLATGTLTDMETSVDLVTTAMKVYNINASDSAHITDVFANAVNNSKLTVEKLRTAMNYVGPIAESSGISFEELSASMMSLANSGLRASQIGTGLRRVFAELIDPSDKLKEASKQAGIALAELDPRASSLSSVIRNLGIIVDDAQVALDIFGKRGAAAVLSLTESQQDFNVLLDSVGEVGTAAQMASTQMEGLGVSWKNVKDRLSVLAVALGKLGITDAFHIMIQAIKAFSDVLIQLVDNDIARFIGKATLLVASLTAIVGAFKLLLSVNITSILTGIASRFSAIELAAGASASSVKIFGASLGVAGLAAGGIITVIGAVAYGLYKLSNQSKKASEEALKLSHEYKSVQDSLESYALKTVNMAEGSKEHTDANIELRKNLLEVADGYDEISIYALDAADSIDPLTGKIKDQSEALAILNRETKRVEFEKLVESIQMANDATVEQTGFFKTMITNGKDAFKLLSSVFDGTYSSLQETRKEATLLAKEVHSGNAGFKELHEYFTKNSKITTSVQKELFEVYKNLRITSGEVLKNMIETGKIHMSQPIEDIKAYAENIGITGDALDAFLKKVEKIKEEQGIFEGGTVGKWANEFQSGVLTSMDDYIEKYKAMGGIVKENQEELLKATIEEKKIYAQKFIALEDWKNKQIVEGNASIAMWEKYYSDLASLNTEASAVSRKESENRMAQNVVAFAAEIKKYEAKLKELEIMYANSAQILAKKIAQLNKEHAANMSKLLTQYDDPKEIYKNTKEVESALNARYKMEEEKLETSLLNQGASSEKIRTEKARLESQLADEIVTIWRNANQQILDQNEQDTDEAAKVRKKLVSAELEVTKAITDIRSAEIESSIKAQNILYKDANNERNIAHAKVLEDITKRELEGVTTSEAAAKEKLDAELKFLEDQKNAAQSHFDEIKDMYAANNSEYIRRQNELASKTEAYLKKRTENASKYAAIEYEIEKAKIDGIKALNDVLYKNSIDEHNESVQIALEKLKSAYDAGNVEIQRSYADRQELAEKDFTDTRTILEQQRAEVLAHYKELSKITNDAIKRSELEKDMNLELADIDRKLSKAKNELEQNTIKLSNAQRGALEENEKAVRALLSQMESLKASNTTDVFGTTEELEALIRVEKEQLEEKLRNIEEAALKEIEIGKNKNIKLRELQENHTAIMNAFDEKARKQRLEKAFEYMDREYEAEKDNLNVIKAIRLKELDNPKNEDISNKNEEKLKIQKKYYDDLLKLVDDYLDEIDKKENPKEYARVLGEKNTLLVAALNNEAAIYEAKTANRIKKQEDQYKKANSKRLNELNKTLLLIDRMEAAGYYSSEKASKKKLDAEVNSLKEREKATGSYLDEALRLYGRDSDEYRERQEELFEITDERLKKQAEKVRLYADIEYGIEKAKIEKLLALNKVLMTNSIKEHDANINVAKAHLENQLAEYNMTIKNSFDGQTSLERKRNTDTVNELEKNLKIREEYWNERIKLEPKEELIPELEKDKDKDLKNIRHQITEANTKLAASEENLSHKRSEAIKKNKEAVDSLMLQLEQLKVANTTDTFGTTEELEARIAAERTAFEKKLRMTEDHLDEEIKIGENADEKLKAKKELNDAIMLALDEKYRKLRLKRSMEYDKREYDDTIKFLDKTKKVQEVYRKEAMVQIGAIDLTDNQAEKLSADVDYWNERVAIAERFLAKINAEDSPEEYSAMLRLKLEAEEKYGEALIKEVEERQKIIRAIEDGKRDIADAVYETSISNRANLEKKFLEELKTSYQKREITTKEFYQKKREIEDASLKTELDALDKRFRAYIDVINAKILAEDDADKKATLNAQKKVLITEHERDYNEALQETAKTKAKINGLEDKEVSNINKKVRNALNDIADSTASIVMDLDSSGFEKKQNLELEIFKRAQAEKLRVLEEEHATKEQLREVELAQEVELAEKKKLLAQEEKDYKLGIAASLAGGMATIVKSMYDAGIVQSKEAFMVYKGLALAEATISAFAAMNKAMEQGGVWGYAEAAIIFARAMANVASISAEQPSYADGGLVAGYSPHPKADNIQANLTANEFVEPVKAVNYYGVDVMEALRTLRIPRDSMRILASGTQTPIVAHPSRLSFAEGGIVSQSAATNNISNSGSNSGKEQRNEISIVNVLDTSLFSDYLSTASGQNAILNVLNTRSQAVRRIVK